MTAALFNTLDTTVAIETPEGVSMALSPAGPVPRLLAWLIDMLLRAMIYIVAMLPLSMLDKAGTGLLLLLVFFLEWFYPVLFEIFNRGATPGKAVVGLRVVEANGHPIGWSASTVRNFLRFADFLPLLYLSGLISMLLTRRFQRLGDLAANTLVVHQHEIRKTTMHAGTPQTDEPLPTVAPNISLSRADQQALIALADRQAQLSRERLDELAAIVPQLSGNDSTQQRTRLLAMARYLSGAR